MKSKVITLLTCLGILALCGACSSGGGEQAVSPLSKPTFASPATTAVATVPASRPSCLTLIEPVGNTVCGYVVYESDNTPVVGRPVFLAEALFGADNSIVFAALDQNTAPKGVTDENGMFYVVDVPSNLYFLMISDYPQPVMLHEPDNPENDLMVDWREKEGAFDLGVIPSQVFASPEP